MTIERRSKWGLMQRPRYPKTEIVAAKAKRAVPDSSWVMRHMIIMIADDRMPMIRRTKPSVG